MCKRRSLRVLKPGLIFMLLLGLAVSPVTGVMVKLSLFKLVSDSDAIVQGVVKDIRFTWSLDKEIILTVAELEIAETIHGDVSYQRILVQYPGGTVGDLSLSVSDMPVLEAEDRVVLFLKRITDPSAGGNSYSVAMSPYPAFEVYGQAQGVYQVDPSGIASKQGYTLAQAGEDRDASMPVSQLREKIGRILRFFREKNANRKTNPVR